MRKDPGNEDGSSLVSLLLMMTHSQQPQVARVLGHPLKYLCYTIPFSETRLETKVAGPSTECQYTTKENEEPHYKPLETYLWLLRGLCHPFRQLCYQLLHTDLLNTRENLEFKSSEKENRHNCHGKRRPDKFSVGFISI